MVVDRLQRRFRTCGLALLVWLGMACCARPAWALGCHVPDRPALAFTAFVAIPAVSPADLEIDRPTDVKLARQPCPAEMPGGSGRVTLRMAAPDWPLFVPAPGLTPARLLAEEGCPLPRRCLRRVDRPPRTPAVRTPVLPGAR